MSYSSLSPHILLVDDDPSLLRLLTIRLRSLNFCVSTAKNGKEAAHELDFKRPDLIISDIRMDQMDGHAFFKHAHHVAPLIPFIMMTAHGSIQDAVEATQIGAFAYLTKPLDADLLVTTIQEALSSTPVLQTPAQDQELLSQHPLILELDKSCQNLAPTNLPLLFQGQPGTGRSFFAQRLHKLSKRSGAFINCDGSLLDHISLEQKAKEAYQGSLLIRNIEHLNLEAQKRLCQLLQQNTMSQDLDFRLLASSSENLEHLYEELYYQITTVCLQLPGLHERREDITILARGFLDQIRNQYPTPAGDFAPKALKHLKQMSWPGHCRQLYHVVMRCAVTTTTKLISETTVCEALHQEHPSLPSYAEAKADFERSYVMRLLKATEGNVSQAAKIAKRNRSDFYKLLARCDLEPQRFKVKNS